MLVVFYNILSCKLIWEDLNFFYYFSLKFELVVILKWVIKYVIYKLIMFILNNYDWIIFIFK